MTTIGLLCLGAGIGVLISAFWWWEHGYRTGYHDGVDDTNALICGGDDVTGC